METETPVKFQREFTNQECDLATLIGLALAHRVLDCVPDGEALYQSRMAINRSIRDHHYNDRARAYKLASKINLPAIADQPGTAIPLNAWSDAIWQAIIDERERCELCKNAAAGGDDCPRHNPLAR